MKNRLFLLLFSVLFASLIFAGAVSAYYDGSVYRVEKVSSYPDGSERTAYYEKRTDYGYQGYSKTIVTEVRETPGYYGSYGRDNSYSRVYSYSPNSYSFPRSYPSYSYPSNSYSFPRSYVSYSYPRYHWYRSYWN